MLTQAELSEIKKKCKISEACFEGMVAHAGYSAVKIPVDDDYGSDYAIQNLVFRENRRRDYGIAVHFQLKGSTNWEEDGENILYPLEVKSYNDMVGRNINGVTPLILALMCLCKDGNWLAVNPDEIVFKKHLLWYVTDATNLSELSENSKIPISVPKKNVLTENEFQRLVNQYRPRVQ